MNVISLKSIPVRLANLFKSSPYRFGASYLTEMSIPPAWNTSNYLQVYGEVGWLFGAVSLIANSVADSEWHLFAGDKEIDDHPLLDLLWKVNPFQTGYQFKLLTQMYISLVGEAFIVLEYNKLGIPAQMWLVPPGYMNIVATQGNYISYYEYKRGTQVQRLEIPEVIHIMDPNPANPYRGVGAAHSIATDLDSERYASQYQRKLFFNDARPGLVVEVPGDQPPKEEQAEIYKQWNAQFRGWGKAYSTAFLWGGAKMNNVTMTNRDMDFGALRKATRDVILAAFHVPESLIGATEVGSRARAEADEYIFAKYTIKPALTRMRESFNEQLCPLFDEGLELAYENPVPEDRVAIVDECSRMVAAGIYTREFALQRLGYTADDMKGGTYLMPIAIIPEQAKAITKSASRLTEQQKEAYWQIWKAKTEAQEKPFQRMLTKLLDEQQGEVIGNLEEFNNPTFNEEKAVEDFAKSFEPLIHSVYKAHFEDVIEGIRPRNPHTSAHKQGEFLPRAAIDWIKTRSLTLAKLLNETTRDELRDALAEGMTQGESIPDIADRIRGYYTEAEARRATVTARTEVISASAEGSITAYETEGVKEVEFYIAFDERTCPECRRIYDYTRIWSVRESRGIIPIHPMCRCVWLAVV